MDEEMLLQKLEKSREDAVLGNYKDADTVIVIAKMKCGKSPLSRGDFLSPLTPPYMPFGIRRFNITSKHDAHCNSQDSL